MHEVLIKVGEAVAYLLIGWLTGMAGLVLSYSKKIRARHRALPESHQQDIEILILLDRLLGSVGADRVYLYQFFNGNHYLSDNEIMRKVRTHERCAPRIAPNRDDEASLLSKTPEEISLVLKSGPSFTPTNKIPESRFRWLLETNGIVAVARCAVTDRKGRMVGFVGADFASDVEPANVSEVCKAARSISQVLARY